MLLFLISSPKDNFVIAFVIEGERKQLVAASHMHPDGGLSPQPRQYALTGS